mgnify:FL=1|jgi:hypothetical protein|tara:strand:+ start:33 stop:236 length:204 start_codon:yes stop_codon:yes gene_type:complete
MTIEFKPDKLEAYVKIMKVIDSCKTKQQLIGASNMVKAFERVFNDTESNKDMIKDLYSSLSIKHTIL